MTAYTFLFPVSFTRKSWAFEIESWFLEEITTLQPSVARTFATPSPIPLLEAGTSATFSANPSSIAVSNLLDAAYTQYHHRRVADPIDLVETLVSHVLKGC